MAKTYVVEVFLTFSNAWSPSNNFTRKDKNVFKSLKAAQEGIKTHGSTTVEYRIVEQSSVVVARTKGGK